METTTATYDGEVLRPDGKLNLKPGDRVRVTIEKEEESGKQSHGWLKTARDANLEGPSDAPVRYEQDLYGREESERRSEPPAAFRP